MGVPVFYKYSHRDFAAGDNYIDLPEWYDKLVEKEKSQNKRGKEMEKIGREVEVRLEDIKKSEIRLRDIEQSLETTGEELHLDRISLDQRNKNIK